MKLGKMYTKILLSFLAVLFVTEVLVFYLFVMIPVRRFNVRFEELAERRVAALKEIVEEKIRSEPGVPWSENAALRNFMNDFGRLLAVRIWLTDRDGKVVLSSFPGSIPEVVGDQVKQKRHRYFSFALHGRRDFDFYVEVPVGSSTGQAGNLHLLLNKQGFSPQKAHFALGLAVIGFFIALSIIPISRFMTRRIKQLRESAARISEGELSHRAAIEGKDEIGELARTFNAMTDRLESMIMGGKALIANVSHELRTPLTRIRIAEELVREKLLQGKAEDATRQLDAIREDIAELDAFIGRILELSKLDMSESPLRQEPLDPSVIIKEVLEKLRPVTDLKGLQVTGALSYEPPFFGDREALGSAFTNVLDNAAKFTPEKGAVSVEMKWLPHSLEVRVTNSFGILSGEDLSHMFDPFHRATRSPAAGSGLGLAITKRAIERHGGSIHASNAAKGVEIAISLPRRP